MKSMLLKSLSCLLAMIGVIMGSDSQASVMINWGYISTQGNAFNSSPFGNFGYDQNRTLYSGTQGISYWSWAGNSNSILAPAYSFGYAGIDMQSNSLRSDSRAFTRYQAPDQNGYGSSFSSSGASIIFTATSSFLTDISARFFNRFDLGSNGYTDGYSWAYLEDLTLGQVLYSRFEVAVNGVTNDNWYYANGIRLNAGHVYQLYSGSYSTTSSYSGTDYTRADHYALISMNNFTPIPEPTSMVVFGGMFLIAAASYRRQRAAVQADA